MNGSTKNALIVTGAILLLTGAIIFASVHHGRTAGEVHGEVALIRKFQGEMRAAEIWGCQHEKNPDRAIKRAEIREEIQGNKRAKDLRIGGIPKPLLHRLIRAKLTALRRRLRHFRPVNCGAYYPAP